MSTPTYASWLDRLFAYIVDVLVLLLPTLLILMVTGDLQPVPGKPDAEPAFMPTPVTVALTFLTNIAYYTAFISSRRQATPGMRLFAIRVVRTDGKLLSQRDALERFLAFLLPSLPLYTSFLPDTAKEILVVWLSLLWFAPILYTPQRTGMHDKLCNTRVVNGRLA